MPSFTTEIVMTPTDDVALPEIVSGESLRIGTGGTRRFVGAEHGAGVSYFLVDNRPGEGPDLHWHPYPETWVIIDGSARITVGEHTFIASAGDTATVPAGVWHRFENVGEGRLRVLCIHASPVIVQTWADEQ